MRSLMQKHNARMNGRLTDFSSFSGACNEAVRPCGAQFAADLNAINILAPGADREAAVNAFTEKMAKCMSGKGWPCVKVGKDTVKFSATGDTMDIVQSSGSGYAQVWCGLQPGSPNYIAPDSNGGAGGGGGGQPTFDFGAWMSTNWWVLLVAGAGLFIGIKLLTRGAQ